MVEKEIISVQVAAEKFEHTSYTGCSLEKE